MKRHFFLPLPIQSTDGSKDMELITTETYRTSVCSTNSVHDLNVKTLIAA